MAKGTDIVPAFLTDDMLATIVDFKSAMSVFADSGIPLDQVSDYGHGFSLIKTAEKITLVGQPMVLVQWTFNQSDKHYDENGNPLPFVSVYVVTQDKRKVIINDGSTGIYRQLRNVSDARIAKGHPMPNGGLVVPQGLTYATYPYTDESGKTSEATTYYLSESAA